MFKLLNFLNFLNPLNLKEKMKEFKFKIDGETYNVAVEEKDANLAEVQVNGKTFTVEVEDAPKAQAPKPVARPVATAPKAQPATVPVAERSRSTGGANSVKAPLPGTIFKIEVNAGQAVKKGAVLLVMEAMKMENNILAAKDGTVKAVYVQLGQTVLPGDALVDLE
ncbi:acetyl-CoA carboxylase biotin carboxyl carrier protein subunit [Bacteroidia bacterium]|nr:acetyl-CoA carboxylase biotin carboxyl carrier protein subunit [Bacteroidia bacterium]